MTATLFWLIHAIPAQTSSRRDGATEAALQHVSGCAEMFINPVRQEN